MTRDSTGEIEILYMAQYEWLFNYILESMKLKAQNETCRSQLTISTAYLNIRYQELWLLRVSLD